MIYKETIKIGLKDIEKQNYLGNKAILEYLENIAGHHADSLGYGLNTMDETDLTWVLLEWKIKVLKRIQYGQNLTLHTWSRSIERCYGNRDFEIYDENNELCVIATSKWLLLDVKKGSIAKADYEMIQKYDSEHNKAVFENEKFDKIGIPEIFKSNFKYKVNRKDIDVIGHMHNIYYLDLAYEALPEDIYEKRLFENIRITYKKEIKYGEVVNCKYTFKDNKHIIVIEDEEGNIVHAIVELY